MDNDLKKIFELKKKKKLIMKELYRYLYNLAKKTIILYVENNKCECIYNIPFMIFGYPRYKIKDVSKYIIKKLNKNGIKNILFIEPNYLYINWDNI